MEKIRRNEKYDFCLLLCIFLSGVLLRFGLGCYLKTPTIYWDELLYHGIARSIFQGSGIRIRNVSTSFQKVLYSLMLAPTFGIHSPALRIRIITLLNVLVMNSCVFPFWKICTWLKLSRRQKLFLSVLLVLWPDLLFTETFMSENLYWPLFFWYVLLHFQPTEHRPLVLGLCEGALVYCGFLCKEIFLFVLPVTAICLILESKLLRCPRGEFRQEWLRLVYVVSGFLLLFFTGKFFLFCSLDSGYDLAGIKALFVDLSPVYIIYASLYLFVSALLSVQLLPFAIPFLRFRQLQREHQRLFLFLALVILFTILVVAYTISICEDGGSTIPRIHLRYFAPALFLLLPIFLLCPEPETEKQRKTEGHALLLLAFLIVVMFRGATETDIDQYTLQWASGIHTALTSWISEDEWLIYLLQVLAAAAVLGTGLLVFLFARKRGKHANRSFLLFLLIPVLCSNAVGHCSIKRDYTAYTEGWDSVCRLSDIFSQTDSHVLYLSNTYSQFRQSKVWDACYEPVENLYYYIYTSFFSPFGDSEDHESIIFTDGEHLHTRVCDCSFSGYIYEGCDSRTDRIDYLVIPEEAQLRPEGTEYFTYVPEWSDEYYSVYKNKNPEILDLTSIVDYSQDAE